MRSIVEVLVGDEHVRALARLLLLLLERLDRPLASLFDKALLDVPRQVDGEHAEVARVVVELHRGVARGAGRLLVRGKQRILERLDQRAALDAFLALDCLDAFDDLSRHFVVTSSIRLPRTMAS